ncbi:MAG: endo-1,4-beta-xylanase, partial [Lachnospiraceae bacterium]|nr:endo-1,4-beta-xylanase [Lachnospiraceae bacterium]
MYIRNRSQKAKHAGAVMTAILLATALTGCGGKDLPTEPKSAPEETTQAADQAAEEKEEAKEDTAAEQTDAAEEETQAPEDLGIETDIPDLRSVVASADGLGEDAIMGACLGGVGAADAKLMALVEKHFNAVTLENELKMDSMFGYNNDAPAPGSIHDEELNGETISVPTLDYSRADAILDQIVAWNEANPDKKIRVRGHV